MLSTGWFYTPLRKTSGRLTTNGVGAPWAGSVGGARDTMDGVPAFRQVLLFA